MKTLTTQAKIGDFLKRIKRPIDLIDDKEYKLVTIKLHHNGVTLRGTKKGSEIKSKMYEVKAGDFILSGIDARNGAFGIVPEELDGAIVTNDFWYFDIDEEIIDKHFFLELTATEWFDEICKKGSDGTTQRIRLQKDKFFNQTINLPDRSEQDKLLTVFKSRKKLTEKLSARITNHLELIPLLRQQVLQDAITGKLSEKWRKENPKIESAEVLLEKIKTGKEKLVKEGKIRKQKPLPPIAEDEIPFELPEGWAWCRLGELGETTTGTTPKTTDPENFGNYIPFIKPGDISEEGVNYDNEKLSPKGLSAGRYLSAGSILMVCIGGSTGKSALISRDISFNQQINALTPLRIVNNYVYFTFISKYFYNKVRLLSSGSATPIINKSKWESIPFPLPPHAEQQYIVERIESLFAKLDRIKELNIENQANIGLLNQVVLKEMFED